MQRGKVNNSAHTLFLPIDHNLNKKGQKSRCFDCPSRSQCHFAIVSKRGLRGASIHSLTERCSLPFQKMSTFVLCRFLQADVSGFVGCGIGAEEVRKGERMMSKDRMSKGEGTRAWQPGPRGKQISALLQDCRRDVFSRAIAPQCVIYGSDRGLPLMTSANFSDI